MHQYTNNDTFLSLEQRNFYEDNGYLTVPKLVNSTLLDNCRSRFGEICNNGTHTPDMLVMKELSLKNKNVKGEYLVNKIQNLMNDDVLSTYGFYKPLVDIVETVIGPNVTCCHSMIINKPPNAEPESSKHALHQDFYYFPFGPPNSIVASWTAIDNSHERNGCLYVYPGTHKMGLLHHQDGETTKNVGFYEIPHYDKSNPVHLVVEEGDTIFLHPLILHGSGPNFTKDFRKAISCFFINSNNCSLINFKGTHQETLEKIMIKAYRKKHPHLKSYLESWKLRSKLVRGPPGIYQRYLSQL